MDAEQLQHKIAQVADAMMRQDTDATMAHFAADALAISPGGRWHGRAAMHAAWSAFNRDYTDIRIHITQTMLDGERGAVEWTFSETRKADGFTRVMQDAIIFTLRDDQFVYWREYFDPLQEHTL